VLPVASDAAPVVEPSGAADAAPLSRRRASANDMVRASYREARCRPRNRAPPAPHRRHVVSRAAQLHRSAQVADSSTAPAGKRSIGPLRSGPDLLDTLSATRRGGNVNAVRSSTHVHRNTMLAKLDRISRASGWTSVSRRTSSRRGWDSPRPTRRSAISGRTRGQLR